MKNGARPRRGAIGTLTLATLLTLSTLLTVAGCTSNPVRPAPAGPAGIPADDEQAIAHTIDQFNATAAGPVAGQQSTLSGLIDPGQRDALTKCPSATVTLRFEPIYPGLRPAPDWTPSSGELAGTIYALPALIRIYTGERITGTDLTTLHLGVRGGEAFLTPLCVG